MRANRAAELELVNELTAPGDALKAALVLAAKLLANGPWGLAAAKRVVCDSRDWSDADMFERQAAYCAAVFASEDAKEVRGRSLRSARRSGKAGDQAPRSA